jgi:hypothetical protein
MHAVFGDCARAQGVVEVTARGAGFQIVNQDTRTAHEAWDNLVLVRIVGSDSGDEAAFEIQVFGQEGRL